MTYSCVEWKIATHFTFEENNVEYRGMMYEYADGGFAFVNWLQPMLFYSKNEKLLIAEHVAKSRTYYERKTK